MDRLASLGVMASGIAHEIRNPLAGIKAIAQTFEDELDKTDPKNEYVKRIIKQVNRLDEMLKSLFSYAKPPKPNRQFFHIKELMQDVLSLLKRKIQSQNIKLVQSYDKEIPPVFVDNSQIQQVIFNLLLNGIEAIDKNGEISIKSSRVDPHQEFFQRKPFFKKFTENPFVLIAIRDNGCGITPENLQQIFNPFFTTKNFGTGLGLSIVYQIVQENNGIIYYESKVGEGTECFLFLPAFEPAKLSKH
jgi:signal transduction histidine kinase